MVTKEQLMKMDGRGELHCVVGAGCLRAIGPRGGVKERIMHVRLTGKCRTWKTDPERFEQPVRYGLRINIIINKNNAYLFHGIDDCPVDKIIRTKYNVSAM